MTQLTMVGGGGFYPSFHRRKNAEADRSLDGFFFVQGLEGDTLWRRGSRLRVHYNVTTVGDDSRAGG